MRQERDTYPDRHENKNKRDWRLAEGFTIIIKSTQSQMNLVRAKSNVHEFRKTFPWPEVYFVRNKCQNIQTKSFLFMQPILDSHFYEDHII